MPSGSIMPLRVVIAGGGVAGLEALMALHDLGEQRFELVLVAPHDDYVLRAMSVVVPFGGDRVDRVALDALCAAFGAEHRLAAVEAVDATAHRLRCTDGAEIGYDVLVLATGAVARPAFAEALTFSDESPMLLAGLLREITSGDCTSLALVVPPAGSWALPVYELALLIARHARRTQVDPALHIVTPEPAPLAIFGPPVSAAVAGLLEQAAIRLHTGSYASVSRRGRIVMAPGDRRLTVDRVLALPMVDGRPIEGIPSGEGGFFATDEHGCVRGCADVYAVGDNADFPVKQGGLAAQQADAAARHIAARAGAPVVPEPFRPILRGKLLTGRAPRYLRTVVAGGGGEGRVSGEPLWWPPAKVVGHYLAPWLERHVPLAGSPTPAGAIEVEAHLPAERDAHPLAIEPLGPPARHHEHC